MKRELPTYTIMGTDFLVDVDHLLLREKANPENTILISEMHDTGTGYELLYDPRTKNLPALFNDIEAVYVKIPELVQLDPEGMSIKYGCPEISGKTDFDLMVDQEAFSERVKKGRLTTVDIAGYTFYVDIPMDMLRPKDDFLSNGIVFSDIQNHFDPQADVYIIPYNPRTHEFEECDFSKLTDPPKDLIVISFPHESKMDPVGFNRKFSLQETYGLKQTNIRSHFVSGRSDWMETGVGAIIRENRLKQEEKLKQAKTQQKVTKRSRRHI